MILLRGTGRWDEALAVFDGSTIETLPTEARATCLLVIGYIEAARARRPFIETLAEVEGFLPPRSAGPQTSSQITALAMEAAMLEARLDDADALGAERTVGTLAAIVAGRRGKLAIIRGDVERARAALADPAWASEVGGIPTASRRLVEAGIAALEGRRDEAVSGFRTSFEWYRDNELWWFLGEAEIMAAHALGPNDPETEVMLAESRAIWERLEAVRFLEQIDALEARSTSAATPATIAGSETVTVSGDGRPIG
jgi:hypothetical protein